MIVTTRTGNGETHEPSSDYINPVINDFILPIQKTPPQREKPHGSQRPFVFAELKMISCQLLDHE